MLLPLVKLPAHVSEQAVRTIPSERWWFLVALIAIAAVQAAFLLFPGPFWDGYFYHLLFERQQHEDFMSPAIANGRPLGGWVIWQAMDWLGIRSGPKALMALSVVGAGAALYAALRIRNMLAPSDACLVTVMAMTGPAMQSVLSASMLQFFVGFFFFFSGLYVFLLADTRGGWTWLTLYSFSLLMAGLSVLFAEAPLALLPFYPVALAASRRNGNFDMRYLIAQRRVLMRHAGPVVIGVVALAATFHLFPTHGLGDHTWNANLLTLLKNGVLFVIAIALCHSLIGAILLWRWIRSRQAQTVQKIPIAALTTALVVLLLGIVPYLAGGRSPSIFVLGWEARFLLFSGLGAGLLVLFITHVLTGRAESRWLQHKLVIVLSIAAMVTTLCRIPLWAARDVKDDATKVFLAHTQKTTQTTVIWVEDHNRSIGGPYRNYEWTGMVQIATARRNVIALTKAEDESAALTNWQLYLYDSGLGNRSVDRGCVADLVIERLPLLWPVTATVGLIIRVFSSQEHYQRWLRGRVIFHFTIRNGCGA